MSSFPAFFDLDGKTVLIAGGDETARRKARLLSKAGANLRFVDETASETLREEFPAAAIEPRPVAPADFETAALAVVAIEEADKAERLAAMARAARTPVNVVDRPHLCDFTVPSIVNRGDVVVGISTGGAAPVLGRSLRAKIETLLPRRLGDVAAFAKSLRGKVKETFTDEKARRRFWENFFDSPSVDAVLNGEAVSVKKVLAEAKAEKAGRVDIVGAGPGDPELLTLKALRLLQEADVILYDKLVGDGVMELARRDADRVFVGKSKADHAMPQTEIEALMARLAGEGKRVVRLKGGDPFVFGRGGEELETLKAEGVDANVTPGITAATGCGAAAGVPLTHRDHAQAVTFVTGYAKNGAAPDLDWKALANPNQTVVVYMGVTKAEEISANLIAHGRDAATPVAVIENGTRDDQLIAKGDLGELPRMMDQAGVKGPALLVIGEVAASAQGRGLIDFSVFTETMPAAGADLERAAS